MRFFIALLIPSILFSCQENRFIQKYDDGKLRFICNLEDDLKNGIGIEFNRDGDTISISNWENDMLNGLSKIFDSLGRLEQEVYFENNERQGLSKKYHANGQEKEVGYFINGKAMGDYYYYDENGLLLSKRDYAVIEGKSILNQWWGYDSLGNLNLNNSNFITIEPDSDGVKFELTASLNGGTAFLSIGKANFDFGAYEEVYLFKMDEFTYKVDYSKLVEMDTIRGFVEDREVPNENGAYQVRKIYFELTQSDFEIPFES